MMVSSLLFYRKLRKDLEQLGFKINPYDICVANKLINRKQLTILWHVDDLKISHKDKKVVDQFSSLSEPSKSMKTVRLQNSSPQEAWSMII